MSTASEELLPRNGTAKLYNTKILEILQPDHCSSCHADWSDSNYLEEYCCAKAPSNIAGRITDFVNSEFEAQRTRIELEAKERHFQAIVPDEGVDENTKGTFADGYAKAVEDICNNHHDQLTALDRKEGKNE